MEIRCCETGKVCFTRKEAGERLKWASKKSSQQIPRRAYFCEICRFWHLTHYKKNNHEKRKRVKFLLTKTRKEKQKEIERIESEIRELEK